MGWKRVDYALKHAPVERGIYFIGLQRGGGKVRMLYIGSTHTESNLRVTLRKVFTGGSIDAWDKGLVGFLNGTSRKFIVVDWICGLRFPQDVIGDYVQENLMETGIFPRFNPRSEYRWDKKDEPFMQY